MDEILNVILIPMVMQYWLDEFMEDDPYWEKISVNVEEFRLMGDPAFRWHFRLSKPMFEILLVEVRNHLVDEGRVVRERTDLSHILLMVLWVLATPECFRAVALRFGVYLSALHNAYVYIIEALREIGERYITWPDANERNIMKGRIQDYSEFPGIIGIMDGCSVPISAPLEDKVSYRDYHLQYSIKMQAVCDFDLVVRDLYVGEAGSLHDARVFRRSPLCRNLFYKPDMLSQGEHIIADSAYMLLDKVLTPFENNGHLTPIQKNYNRKLCKVRARVEHTFGHAQGLWRRLRYLHVVNMDYAVDHIVASVVLHNFRILHGDRVPMFEAPDGLYANEEARVVADDEQVPQPVLDVIPDPHAHQGHLFQRMVRAHLLGEQKRWDICNQLPMD